MATDADLTRLRALVGTHLPDADGTAAPYTDAELQHLLTYAGTCPGGRADVYAAAAQAWEEKATDLEVRRIAEPGTDGHMVTTVKQADAQVTYARPVPLGSNALPAYDRLSMLALAKRLRSKSCNRSSFGSVDVAPPNVLTPRRYSGVRDYDGDPGFTDPRTLSLTAANPDAVLNLPDPEPNP